MFFRKKKAAPADKESLAGELRAVRKAGLRTSLFVLLLTSGIAPAFAWWSQPVQDGLSVRQTVAPLYQVATRTYPLTLSIAVIAFGKRRGWFRKRYRLLTYPAIVTAGAWLSNQFSGFTGQSIESAQLLTPHQNPVTGTMVSGANQLAGYFQAYGARQFCASILVGMFAGWAAFRLSNRVGGDEIIAGADRWVRDKVDEQRKAA